MAEIRKPTRKLGPPAQGFTMPPAPKPRPAVTTSPTTKSDLCYAGIGSRETPPNVQKDMQELARILAENGWHLRTGGADGADTAFAQGASRSETPQKGGTTIYLPWGRVHGLSGPETKVLSSSQQTLAQKEISHIIRPGEMPPGRQEAPRTQRRHHPRCRHEQPREGGDLLDTARRQGGRHRHRHPPGRVPQHPGVQPGQDPAAGDRPAI